MAPKEAKQPMGLDTVHDKDLEKILKHYCNTPFFRDNPYYIRLWERYYVLCNKDPAVLFFMRHKRISKNYHFLYIELSRHFELKGLKDVSAWVLQRAIEAGVYRNDILVSELIRLGRPPNTLTRDEIARELNREDLVFWGKKWYSKESIASCEKKAQENSSHGCMKDAIKETGEGPGTAVDRGSDGALAHVCTKAPVATPCVLCNSGRGNADIKEHSVIYSPEKVRGECLESGNTAMHVRKISSVCRMEAIRVGSEFVVENHTFYVKSKVGKCQHLVVKMNGDLLEYQPAETSYYTLQAGKINGALFDKFVPERMESLGCMLLYKHYELGLLSSAVHSMPELNDFFFLKALEVAMYYAEKDVFFSDLSTDDLFIDDDMSLILCTFSQNERCCVWSYSIFSELETAHTSGYRDTGLEEALRELDAKLRIIDTEVLLLRLKVAIFEKNVAECNGNNEMHFSHTHSQGL